MCTKPQDWKQRALTADHATRLARLAPRKDDGECICRAMVTLPRLSSLARVVLLHPSAVGRLWSRFLTVILLLLLQIACCSKTSQEGQFQFCGTMIMAHAFFCAWICSHHHVL